MDILVPDLDRPMAAEICEALQDRGHRVLTCMAPSTGKSSWTTAGGSTSSEVGKSEDELCAALHGAPCPIDSHRIDVALELGRPSSPGALCAVRHRIPLLLANQPPMVILGPSGTRVGGHPLENWAASVLGTASPLDTVREAESLATSVLPHHTSVAQEALNSYSAPADEDGQIAVEVRRRDGCLHIDLTFTNAHSMPSDLASLGDHIVQAVRSYDPWAKQVNIAIHMPANFGQARSAHRQT